MYNRDKRESMSILLTIITNIQEPSDHDIKKRVAADHQVLSALALDGKGIVEKVYEEGVWKFYYQRSFRARLNDPKQPENKIVVKGAIRYIKAGSRYVFNTIFFDEKDKMDSTGTR